MYLFVVANTLTKNNIVYLYNKRFLKKDGDSMCNLRLINHLNLLQSYINQSSSLPHTYISVMDNCIGQNKSKTVLSFFSLLSLIFYERIILIYLLPGHSHMAADRVVSWIKKSLGRNNIYVLEQLIEKINSIQRTTVVYVPDRKIYSGWSELLSKYILPLPPSYTKYYYFEFHNGSVSYKFDPSVPIEQMLAFRFCSNVAITKKATLKNLFSSSNVNEVILKKIVNLPEYQPVELPISKITSLAHKYPTIPAKYLWYYPNQPDKGVEESKSFCLGNKWGGKSDTSDTKRPIGQPKKRKIDDDKQLAITRFF